MVSDDGDPSEFASPSGNPPRIRTRNTQTRRARFSRCRDDPPRVSPSLVLDLVLHVDGDLDCRDCGRALDDLVEMLDGEELGPTPASDQDLVDAGLAEE